MVRGVVPTNAPTSFPWSWKFSKLAYWLRLYPILRGGAKPNPRFGLAPLAWQVALDLGSSPILIWRIEIDYP